MHKKLAVRLLIKATRDLNFNFIPRQRLVKLGLTCLYPERLFYLSRPWGHLQASQSLPKLPWWLPPPCPWSRTHFSPAQHHQSLSQRHCVSASLQPCLCIWLLDGTYIYIIALSLALTPFRSDWVPRMDSGPGAPLTVSRLSVDPVTRPWLCQLCSGPVGLLAHHWRHSMHWDHFWLTLFLDQHHSCCSRSTSHYTVDESEKWVICLFLWNLMSMTSCQIVTLFHSRNLDPPLSALSMYDFFSLPSFWRQPIRFLQEKLQHSQQYNMHQHQFKRDNLSCVLYRINQHNS